MSQTCEASPAPIDFELAPLGLLVVQPTPFCNINCSYCYLSHRSEQSKMELKTVSAIARFLHGVRLRDERLSVVWHAGEPLTAPIDFYEAAFRTLDCDAAPILFQHHFQTNGMLIDENWCALFKRWSVRVGVSIDGPQDVHDARRVDRTGRGTYTRVMRGISELQNHSIPFTVIGVITKDTLQDADRFWRFFETLGAAHIAFNVEEVEGVNRSSSLSVGETESSFRAFVRRVAELSHENPQIRVREFDSMHNHLTAPLGSKIMRADNEPGAIVNVDVVGNVTTFSPELLGAVDGHYGRFHWGNVHSDDLRKVVSHPGFKKAHRDILSGIERCRQSCGYFSICGGGNPSNKLAELGSFAGTETQFCRLHVQAFADVIVEYLEQEIRMRK